MGVLSNKIERYRLEPGDHIYTWRSHLYTHHGIYKDNGKVIHFTRDEGQPRCPVTSQSMNPSGDQPDRNGVIESCLDDFLSGGKLYRFEYSVSKVFFYAKVTGCCTLAASDPAEDVLHRARYLLEKGFGVYDLFKNNCEDFALYCKTGLVVIKSGGVGRSGQVTATLNFIRTSGGIIFASTGVGIQSTAAVTLMGASLATVSLLAIPAGLFVGGLLIGTFVYRKSMDIGVYPYAAKVPVESLLESLDRLNEQYAEALRRDTLSLQQQMMMNSSRTRSTLQPPVHAPVWEGPG